MRRPVSAVRVVERKPRLQMIAEPTRDPLETFEAVQGLTTAREFMPLIRKADEFDFAPQIL